MSKVRLAELDCRALVPPGRRECPPRPCQGLPLRRLQMISGLTRSRNSWRPRLQRTQRRWKPTNGGKRSQLLLKGRRRRSA